MQLIVWAIHHLMDNVHNVNQVITLIRNLNVSSVQLIAVVQHLQLNMLLLELFVFKLILIVKQSDLMDIVQFVILGIINQTVNAIQSFKTQAVLQHKMLIKALIFWLINLDINIPSIKMVAEIMLLDLGLDLLFGLINLIIFILKMLTVADDILPAYYKVELLILILMVIGMLLILMEVDSIILVHMQTNLYLPIKMDTSLVWILMEVELI